MKRFFLLLLGCSSCIGLYSSDQLTIDYSHQTAPHRNSRSAVTITPSPDTSFPIPEENSLQIESIHPTLDHSGDPSIRTSYSAPSALGMPTNISRKSSTNITPIPDDAPVSMPNKPPCLNEPDQMNARFLQAPFQSSKKNSALTSLTPLHMDTQYSNTPFGEDCKAEYDRKISELMQEQDKIKEKLKEMKKNIYCAYLMVSMLACGLAISFTKLYG